MATLRRALSMFGWTKHSSILLSGFFLTIFLILYIWWPLAEEVLSYIDWNGPWWLYMDWLLIGIFLFMSLTIISRADLRTDGLIVFVGVFGGLAIESWGTQTNLWQYYTTERPPLWIIPAWPIASLSIDRITRVLNFLTTKYTPFVLWIASLMQRTPRLGQAPSRGELPAARRYARACATGTGETAKVKKGSIKNPLVHFISFVFNFKSMYWITFATFFLLMLFFVAPTFEKSYTWLSLLLCALLILTPTDHRMAFLTFIAGAGLGYYLELWGTTRECWTYYTLQKPPLFAVLAHGMAAVAFWRAGLVLKMVGGSLGFSKPRQIEIIKEA